jgi:hypothetical protein
MRILRLKCPENVGCRAKKVYQDQLEVLRSVLHEEAALLVSSWVLVVFFI